MTCIEKDLKLFKDTPFRNIERNFVYVRCPDILQSQKDEYEIFDKDDGIFGIGYIDHEAGLSVRMISAAHIENNKLIVGKDNKEIMTIFRAEAIQDEYYYPISFKEVNLELFGFYAECIMEGYYSSCKKAIELRDFEILDQFRHPFYPDDIEISFIGNKIGKENIWLRLTKIKKNVFYGTLLNEPIQNLGYHLGDEIPFNLVRFGNNPIQAIHIIDDNE